MRIGVDARSLGAAETGPGVYTRRLVGQMAPLAPDWEFHLFFAERSSEVVEIPGRNVFCHHLGRPGGQKLGNLVFEQLLLPAAASRLRCDLLWSPVFVLPLWKNLPQVVTVHDAIPILLAGEFSLARRVVYTPILRRNVAQADRIVTVSEASAADISRCLGVAHSRIDIIPNGVNPEYRPLAPGEEAEADRLLARLGLGPSFILSTAGLLPRKNAHRVLLAFAELTRRLGTAAPETLVFTGRRSAAGSDRFSRFLEAEAAAAGVSTRVRFTEHVSQSDLRLLYARARFSIYASLHEGFGFPIVEAMACGCPVITSDRSSMPEVAGSAALLVNPESVEGLVESMARLSGDEPLRAELRKRGLLRARAFRWDESARRLLQSFESVLAGGFVRSQVEAA